MEIYITKQFYLNIGNFMLFYVKLTKNSCRFKELFKLKKILLPESYSYFLLHFFMTSSSIFQLIIVYNWSQKLRNSNASRLIACKTLKLNICMTITLNKLNDGMICTIPKLITLFNDLFGKIIESKVVDIFCVYPSLWTQ